MTAIIPSDGQGTSTRPYLIRALHDWCTDNGFTPYLAVLVDQSVQVPLEYVKNNEIVLNVGFEATSGLKLGNEFVEFRARFGGVAREIIVPVDHVIAIYARENGQGMAFPSPAVDEGSEPDSMDDPVAAPLAQPAPVGGRGGKGLRLAHLSDDGDEAASAPKPVAEAGASEDVPGADPARGPETDPPPPPTGRPTLKRVK